MDNLTLISGRLRSKLEKLLHLHKKLKEDNNKLLEERKDLLKKIEEYKNSINKLEEKNKVAKLAETLLKTNENSSEVKLKIKELVRELDKCIALLNR